MKMNTARSEESIPSTESKISIDDPRVFLAAERTLLAWVRTSISLMGLGFIISKFGLFVREMIAMRGGDVAAAPRSSLWIGAMMVGLGIVVALMASYEHVQFLHRLQISHFAGKRRTSLSLAVSVLLSVVGVAVIVNMFSIR